MDLALDLSVDELVLGVAGWSYGEGGLSPCQLAEFITYLIYNNYTFNGETANHGYAYGYACCSADRQLCLLSC